MYWIGPLLGAALAALTYRYVFAPDAEREPIDLPSAVRSGPSFVRSGPASPAPTEPHSTDRTERL